MSALQSGHLSPGWCTVSAHDSQKRWCPQGTRAIRGSLRLMSHTLRRSRRMSLLRVQTLLQHPVAVSDRSFVHHPRLRRRRHRSLIEDGHSTVRCGRPCCDSWHPRTASVYTRRCHSDWCSFWCLRRWYDSSSFSGDGYVGLCQDKRRLLDCPRSLAGGGPESRRDRWVKVRNRLLWVDIACELISHSLQSVTFNLSWAHFFTAFDYSCIVHSRIVHPCHMVLHCPLLQCPPLPHRADLSTPTNSIPATWCRIVHSCIVHPCYIVPMCPLLHFPHPHFWPCRFVHSRKFHQPFTGIAVQKTC